MKRAYFSTLLFGSGLFCLLAGAAPAARAQDVGQYGLLQKSFTQSGQYNNAYTSLNPTATLTGPDQQHKTLPLFWDGGSTWRFRFSPDATGQWSYTVDSQDSGLNGAAGNFTVSPSTHKGGIEPVPGHSRHFQRQDGTPVWFMGDTQWKLFSTNSSEQLNRQTAEHYIDKRAQEGFNAVVTNFTTPHLGNNGGQTFDNLSNERINPGYFQEVDQRLAYLNQKGLTGGLTLKWSAYAHNQGQWQSFPSRESRLRYARYITARYSAYNVYFLVSGEWDKPGGEKLGASDFSEIGSEIARDDPQGRIIGIHPIGDNYVKDSGTTRQFGDKSWAGFADYEQNYNDLHQDVLTSRQQTAGGPVVNGEYAYFLRDKDGDGVVDKDHSATVKQIRHATWDIAMAGGYFVTGFGSTYNGGSKDPGPFDVDKAANAPWEQQVQNVAKLFHSVQWQNLDPADDLVSGKGTEWALAQVGKQYVVYVRDNGDSVTLSLGDADPGDLFDVKRFNPRTGDFTDLGTVTAAGDTLTFDTPDDQDWVYTVAVPVPEPTTLALLGLAGIGLIGLRPRRGPAAH